MNQAPAALPDRAVFDSCASAIARSASEFSALGWTPATSGNFSMRAGSSHAVITVSGRDKRAIGPSDVMLVGLDGHAVETTLKSSAETALHLQIYRRFPDITMVLHTHSHVQSVASRLFAEDGLICLQGWELQKALDGQCTHTGVIEIPVFPNTQHMPELVTQIDTWLDADKPLPAYLIAGHGLYAWGRDQTEAQRHLHALEFLLGCELDLRRLQAS